MQPGSGDLRGDRATRQADRLRSMGEPRGMRVRVGVPALKSAEDLTDQIAWAFWQGVDLIPQGLSAPPDLDVEQLMTLLAGLLGFGGMRSFEKHKGVASK